MLSNLQFFKKGERISLRQAFGRILCYAAELREDFVLFDADVAGGTGAKPFVTKYPKRVIQFGIAEQNMMAAAAGFSDVGIIPVVSTFAVFAMMRAHEQFRTVIAYPRRNVKVCCSHLGLDVGPDGPTAQMLEDLAIARSVPNMTVIVPADANEFMLAFLEILDFNGPVYIRIGRSPTPVIFDKRHKFKIGEAPVLKKGKDVTVIATGVMVARSLQAAEQLEKDGISIRVINLSTLKPLDKMTVMRGARETGCIVTCEDHNLLGGLGSAIAELVSQNFPVPIEMVGVGDIFGKSGEPDELAKLYGLTSSDIVKAAKKVLKRKRGELC